MDVLGRGHVGASEFTCEDGMVAGDVHFPVQL